MERNYIIKVYSREIGFEISSLKTYPIHSCLTPMELEKILSNFTPYGVQVSRDKSKNKVATAGSLEGAIVWIKTVEFYRSEITVLTDYKYHLLGEISPLIQRAESEKFMGEYYTFFHSKFLTSEGTQLLLKKLITDRPIKIAVNGTPFVKGRFSIQEGSLYRDMPYCKCIRKQIKCVK